jgi:tripartite-type tricarboxylate transporter receptor subunit TctC
MTTHTFDLIPTKGRSPALLQISQTLRRLRRVRAAACHVLTLIALLAGGLPAGAETYPARPIRLVVPESAGSIADAWARRLVRPMEQTLGQPIVVEYRPGASGTLGAEAVARAAPDGYTLLYTGQSPVVTYPAIGGAVRYDPQRDFTPVALGPNAYPVLVAGAGSGLRSFADLKARAAAREPLSCGTGGHGSYGHFACAMLARALGMELLMVPSKGSSAALQEAAGGQLTLTTGFPSELMGLIAAGRIVPLAAFAERRAVPLPAVPTFRELGVAGMELFAFAGFYAPAGVPPAVVDALNAAAARAMQTPEYVKLVEDAGGRVQALSPAAFAQMNMDDRERWRRRGQELGIRPQE